MSEIIGPHKAQTFPIIAGMFDCVRLAKKQVARGQVRKLKFWLTDAHAREFELATRSVEPPIFSMTEEARRSIEDWPSTLIGWFCTMEVHRAEPKFGSRWEFVEPEMVES